MYHLHHSLNRTPNTINATPSKTVHILFGISIAISRPTPRAANAPPSIVFRLHIKNRLLQQYTQETIKKHIIINKGCVAVHCTSSCKKRAAAFSSTYAVP